MSAPINATPAYTRTSSTSSASSNGSTTRRSSSILATVGHKLAEHHRNTTAAYEAYYGAYARPTASATATPRSYSQDLKSALAMEPEEVQPKQPSKAGKVWQSVKKHAKEHHESVNGAYRAYYGAS